MRNLVLRVISADDAETRGYYEAFGLEPKLSIDAEELKKRFYERSRQWHPDRFSRASAAEQDKALEMTAVPQRRLPHAA